MIINEEKNRTEEYMYMLLLFTKINVYIGKKINCAYSMCTVLCVGQSILNHNLPTETQKLSAKLVLQQI